MELLFVYIPNDRRNIKNCSYNFSSEYIFSYDESTKTFSVEHRKGLPAHWFGKNILNITAIVGKNGTGKTNLLLLLGRAFDKGNMSWCNALLFGEISGRSDIRRTQFVTQNSIGNNPHSIPATYIDAMLPLRKAFSDLAVKGGDNLGVEYFSFNS